MDVAGKKMLQYFYSMRRQFISRLLAASMVFCLPVCLVGFSPRLSYSPVTPQNISLEEQILQQVNLYRQSKSLPVLEMNAAISSEALKHSTAMAGGKTAFGHDGFDGRVGAIRRQLASSRKFAENVAYGHLDAKEVVDIWLNSPGHRRNIEGPYNTTGIGTAKRSDGTIFFTQIFIAR